MESFISANEILTREIIDNVGVQISNYRKSHPEVTTQCAIVVSF